MSTFPCQLLLNFYREQGTVTLIQCMQHSKNGLCAETIAALLQPYRSWNTLQERAVWTCWSVNMGAEKYATQTHCKLSMCKRTGTANQSQHISFFGRWAFIKPGINRTVCVSGERYCNNVNYVKNNANFVPPSTRACSSTPQNKVKTL